jgi:hypothetical protein
MNVTYNNNEVPLTYTIDKEGRYVVYYNLDGSSYTGGNVLTSNTTLTELSEGQHKVTSKAKNGFGIYSENTVYFNINTTKTEKPLSLDQTSTNVIAITVIVVVAIVAVILYYRRNKLRDRV